MADSNDFSERSGSIGELLNPSTSNDGDSLPETKSDSKIGDDTLKRDTDPSSMMPSSLTSVKHPEAISKINSSDSQQCYCMKARNFNIVELQCGSCFRWFHESCITYHIGKCIPFMTNYAFLCKNCNPTSLENFTKKQANFSQMIQTAIANLMQFSAREAKHKFYFSKDKDIIPYIDSNWENLTTMPRRIKQTWHTTIVKTMLKETDIFATEANHASNDPMDIPYFGLVVKDLSKIGPNYESFMKQTQMKVVDTQRLNMALTMPAPITGVLTGKGRSAKRKFPEQMYSSTKKTRSSDLSTPKLPAHGYPLEHPFNKDGYRYILAEPDPHAPHRQEFDESADWAGKPIPGWLYRTLMPPTVLLALNDRAPQLKISDDRMAAIGEKGYCMVRATHGVNRGCWYFEATLDEMPEGSATRLGWSQALGNLQAPLGYDRFSYSWRSRKGTRFHESKGKHYGNPYGEGDTVGFLISLGTGENSRVSLPPTYKDRPLVKFKSHLYYEEKDDVQKAIKNLETCSGSKVVYYKNGVNQGVAWTDVYEGTYYPAVSVYKNVTVSVNFGPKFKHPPKNVKFRGMHEAAHEALVEQAVSDMLYLVENEGKLRLDNVSYN